MGLELHHSSVCILWFCWCIDLTAFFQSNRNEWHTNAIPTRVHLGRIKLCQWVYIWEESKICAELIVQTACSMPEAQQETTIAWLSWLGTLDGPGRAYFHISLRFLQPYFLFVLGCLSDICRTRYFSLLLMVIIPRDNSIPPSTEEMG